jgi:hypothetical protein
MRTSKVAVIRCPAYDEAEVLAAVRSGVDLLGGIDRRRQVGCFWRGAAMSPTGIHRAMGILEPTSPRRVSPLLRRSWV